MLLPLLREQNPRIAIQLAQSAAVAAWDEECLGELAMAYTQDHQKRTPEGFVLDTGTDFWPCPWPSAPGSSASWWRTPEAAKCALTRCSSYTN